MESVQEGSTVNTRGKTGTAVYKPEAPKCGERCGRCGYWRIGLPRVMTGEKSLIALCSAITLFPNSVAFHLSTSLHCPVRLLFLVDYFSVCLMSLCLHFHPPLLPPPLSAPTPPPISMPPHPPAFIPHSSDTPSVN